MSHDKMKAAARERMAATGEPYATARREVIKEHQASAIRTPMPGARMLVWINGPCGVGKTATAFELNRRLPGSVVCDPAHVGYGMRRMLPASMRRGFWQDIVAWRRAVRDVLRLTLAEHDGPVIAPMMLVDPGHHQEIIGRLRDDGFESATSGCPGTSTPACGSRLPRTVTAGGMRRQVSGLAGHERVH
jgi:hypothetical protein